MYTGILIQRFTNDFFVTGNNYCNSSITIFLDKVIQVVFGLLITFWNFQKSAFDLIVRRFLVFLT